MSFLGVLVGSQCKFVLLFSRYPELRREAIRRVAHDFISGKVLYRRRFGREILELQALQE